MTSHHRAPAASVLALLALVLAACGSSVEPANGGGGSTGTGNSGGGGGCPAAEPALGSPCPSVGESCSYGNECCPSVYQCESSGWTALSSGCADPPVMCPADPPAAGAGCNVCSEPGPCTYPCPGTMAVISFTCNGGTWAQKDECPVPPPVDCGGMTCKPGEVCVVTAALGYSYQCAPDPCVPAPLDCSCAAKLCTGPALQCQSAANQTVYCACPSCV